MLVEQMEGFIWAMFCSDEAWEKGGSRSLENFDLVPNPFNFSSKMS